MKRIANGTQATLGNVCKPTAKELIVFPNPENLTINKPTIKPIIMDVINPINNRYIVIPMLVINVIFWINSMKDPVTIKGDGKDMTGNIFNKKVNCQIPRNTVINKSVFAKVSISIKLCKDLTFIWEFNISLCSVWSYEPMFSSIINVITV